MTTGHPGAATPSDAAAPPHGAADRNGAAGTASTLDQSFARSVAWSGAGRWLTQLISWPATIVIARILSPEDYGLVVLVRAYTDFIAMLTEAGLGSAVTIAPEMDDGRAGQLYTISLMLGTTAAAAACAIAYPLASLYDRPGLEWVVFALAAILMIESAGVVPNGLLRREFRYKTLAIADWARTMTDLTVALTLAFLGFGYWTLVFGYMAGAIAWQAVVLPSRPLRFRRVHRADVRSTLHIMRQMVAQQLTYFAVNYSDVIIGGRLVTRAALGAYSYGAHLANVPNAKITGLVANVTPSLFREVRADLPLFRRYVTLITVALSAAVLPAFVGIIVVARDFTSVVLGAKWAGIVVPLQLLALKAAIDAMFTVLPQVLWATNNGRVVTRYGLLNLAILAPLLLVLGREWGVNGLAAAWVIAMSFVQLPRAAVALKAVRLPVREYARCLWPAVSGSLTMVAAVLVVRHFICAADSPAAARLALSVITGVVVYAATVGLFHRSAIRDALAMLRVVRR